MKTKTLGAFQLFALLCTMFVGGIICQAQVYVYVRTDKTQMIKMVNVPRGNSKAQRQVDEQEGDWEKLIETAKEGYGAVFCVADEKKGIKPRYFYSYGKDSQDEAVTEARNEARQFAKQYNQTPFIMGGWYNQNLYPLED